ncbi:hypothetical protein [Acetatifactor aquisgranensis]|nr:hypothetical protein [Acetatifactor aquisgranensis]
MTAKEIFKKSLRDAEEYAKKNELNFIVYMSGKKISAQCWKNS